MLSACEQGGGGRAVEDEASGNDRRRCVGDEDGLHEGGRREVDECSGDYLEEALRAMGPKVILKSAKCLENLEK